MQSKLIKDNQITASSSQSNFPTSKARLNHQLTWMASQSYEKQWLQIDLLEVKKVNGIATQGYYQHWSWVKKIPS